MPTPDFSSIVIEEIQLPYDSEVSYLKLSFTDPMLKDYSLIVILDSVTCSLGNRIFTVIARYPRYVHAEALRHRVFSRNASSSRARSVKSTLKEVMENPIIPLFTVNQKGMGGRFAEDAVREKQIEGWLRARDRAVASVLELLVGPELFDNYGSGFEDTSAVAAAWEEILDDYYENGYDSNGDPKEGYLSTHKQQFNRIIEPYTPFEEVITSTYWDNFLSLRDHEDAQPEIRAIAVLIKAALEASAPQERAFHLPFIPLNEIPSVEADWDTVLKPVFLRSSAEAAQISYNDKSSAAKSTATAALGARLFDSRHLSPFEHPAVDAETYEKISGRADTSLTTNGAELISNFDPAWIQLRPILAGITK